MSVRADVDRGLQIVAQVSNLQSQLREIETRLEAAGLEGEQVELVDPEREGRQYLAHGSSAIVPVVFTADMVVKSFQNDSAVHLKIAHSIDFGPHSLRSFYQPVRSWKALFESGKEFRAKAAELLGAQAPAFVSACLQRDKHGIPKSQTKIDWSRAEKIAQAESEAA